MRYMEIHENEGPDRDGEVVGFPDTLSMDKAAHHWAGRTFYAQSTGCPRPGGFTFRALDATTMLDAIIESARNRRKVLA